MRRFGTGLVVGKFCPLHRGHQYLLDRARAQSARLLVVSYTKPEFDGCGPERRERWLAALYPGALRLVLDDVRLARRCREKGLAPCTLPTNEAGDEAHRGFVAWLLHEVLVMDVDAVFTSEAYGDGFAAALSRAQQARGDPAVAHVAVDPGRHTVPVSGTRIRADIHGFRHWLDPVVYRDLAP